MKNYNTKTTVERFREITQEMVDLYEKKNNNYGDSFAEIFEDFEEFGPIVGIFPLCTKISRVKNLVKGGKNDFESLEDSLIDLANYTIMYLIELEKRSENNEK